MSKYNYIVDLTPQLMNDPEPPQLGVMGKTTKQKVEESKSMYQEMADMLKAYWGSAAEAQSRVAPSMIGEIDADEERVYEDWLGASIDYLSDGDIAKADEAADLQADRLVATAETTQVDPMPRTKMVDVTDTDQGELSNPEPLYEMAKEVDPGTIETKEIGLMSPPVKKNSLLEFIASGEGGYDSANRGTIKEGDTQKIVGSELVASRGGKKVSELTVDEILKYQAIKDPNNKDRLFAVGKYQTDNRTFPMAVEALGLSGDTVFSPDVQEKVGLYLISEKPGRKRLSNYLKNIGDVSTERAMLDLAMEFASVPVPFAIKKGSYGTWPKVDLKAGDSFYSTGKGGNKAQHTVAETMKILEDNKGSVPSANTKGVSPRPMLRPEEE